MIKKIEDEGTGGGGTGGGFVGKVRQHKTKLGMLIVIFIIAVAVISQFG
jgi:hypothetical protein